MDMYKELKLKPVRSQPTVWVSRLVILERLSPEPVIIRDIALTRGLNIVWAEEPENDDSDAEICGHSAGKTTFCRFLRYVLGENTFGTKDASELIRKALPDGYVAAEIHVGGNKWAVRRPFGSGRMSYIKQDATIEENGRARYSRRSIRKSSVSNDCSTNSKRVRSYRLQRTFSVPKFSPGARGIRKHVFKTSTTGARRGASPKRRPFASPRLAHFS